MSVIVITKEFKEDERKYPCLMFAPHGEKSQIVLVTGEGEMGFIGTNINGVGHATGTYSTGWSDSFVPYHGSVVIESAPKEIY